MNFPRAQLSEEDTVLRIVLVGQTGAGKSATANTLIGKKVFDSRMCSVGVTTQCQKESTVFEGQIVAVIDTPGLFDTTMSKEEVGKEIAKWISFAAPGPHAFLVVIQPNRFTEEEEQTVKLIQKMFGEKSSHYTMALFTHGDDLEHGGVDIRTFISKNEFLQRFIRQCHGRYHVINNRVKDPQQVKELLEKIHQMVERNGGSFFTNEMLQEAEKAIREEVEIPLRTRKDFSYEAARGEAEKIKSFVQKMSVGAGMCCGAAVGVVFSTAGAAVGAAVGAAAGAGLGLALNAAAPKIGKRLANSCNTQ